MTSTVTPTPAQHPFLRKIDETKIPKSDINNFIMDYLITEGYPLAAEKFAREAKIQQNNDLKIKSESIEERVLIREAIHKGDMQTAIELINDLNPELLDKDGALHFSLLRLQLIELIRKIPECPDTTATRQAIEFATENLAPRASTNEQWLHEFERAMSLLLFKPTDWAQQQQFPSSSPATTNESSALRPQPQPPFGALSELIDPNLRRKVAKDVNEAILRSQDRTPEARLYQLVHTRAWAEKLARDKKVDLPTRMDLGLDGDQISVSSVAANGSAQNGHANGSDIVMGENVGARTAQRDDSGARGQGGDAVLTEFTNIS